MDNLIEILHRVSNKLTEVTTEIQIYEILHDSIKEILPNTYFLILKLQQDDMNFRIIHSFGFDKYRNSIKTLLRKDPFEMKFPFNDLSDEKKEKFINRKLHHFEGGIYDLANERINKSLCKVIEKILGISAIYTVSFTIGTNHFGVASFFIPKSENYAKGLSKNVVLAIENMAAQASFSINRLREFEKLKKRDDELKITNSRFHQLVNQLNDIVWKANGDGTGLVDLNNSFEKYYGYPSAEFEKNSNLWFDVVHPEDKNIALKATEELFQKGETNCEYRIQRPDGKIFWLHDRKSIVYDLDGKPAQIGGVATDITEKKELEKQLQLKNYALDKSPSAIGLADLNGSVFYVNSTFVKIWGYDSKEELIGKHFSEFSIKGNPSKEALNVIMNKEIYVGEDSSLRKDGTTFNYIVSASLILHNENPLCIMAVFIDNTEQKQLEVKLKTNKAKLEKLNQDKDKFFSIISHDLRSPFNGMLGLLDIVSENYYTYSDEERLKIINASKDSAKKAFNLLSDLLEWAKLQNNKVEINKEVIDLKEIIQENIALFEAEAEKKEISILNNTIQNKLITIDRNSINTVIRNLIINAIKFTPNHGEIEIDVIEKESNIELCIKDTGIGMSEDIISKLFKIDENITTLGTNNEKGTGLGLTICKDIVDLNNWKMNFESQLGYGTLIKILIPK